MLLPCLGPWGTFPSGLSPRDGVSARSLKPLVAEDPRQCLWLELEWGQQARYRIFWSFWCLSSRPASFLFSPLLRSLLPAWTKKFREVRKRSFWSLFAPVPKCQQDSAGVMMLHLVLTSLLSPPFFSTPHFSLVLINFCTWKDTLGLSVSYPRGVLSLPCHLCSG